MAEAPVKSITLEVVASPRSGPPLSGLTQKDFTLLDNKKPMPVSSFKAVTGAPAGEAAPSVMIVVDAVNANFSVVASARDQIEHFLKANDGRLAYPTSMAILTDSGLQIQPTPSTDGNVLAANLAKADIGLRTIRRSEGIYGADDRVQISLSNLRNLAEYDLKRPGRKIILWVSPGWPLLSGPRIQLDGRQQEAVFGQVVDLSALLRQARITLYSVDPLGAGEGVGRIFYYEEYLKSPTKPGQADLGDLALQVLSVQSGGRALASSNDVGDMLKTAFTDLSSFYELTFSPLPAEHPNEYHRLELQVDQPGLTLHTLQGYYAQP